jgi:DNA repair exonuclease SbcCD ATPase subunit
VSAPAHLSESYLAYLRSPEWQRRRLAALRRAGNRCQVCNSSKHLDVHHRTYERFRRELPGDLTVLCRACHDIFHEAKRLAPRPGPKPTLEELARRAERVGKKPTPDPEPKPKVRRRRKNQEDTHLRGPYKGATRR